MASRGWDDAVAAQIAEGRRKAPGVPVVRRSSAGVAPRTVSKYRAVKTIVDGFRFDSKREAARYQELVTLGAAGELRDLELQPRFPLTVNGQPCGAYVGDFRYARREVRGTVTKFEVWRDVVEDVKGVRTPVYRIKKRLVEVLYGIQIQEVR